MNAQSAVVTARKAVVRTKRTAERAVCTLGSIYVRRAERNLGAVLIANAAGFTKVRTMDIERLLDNAATASQCKELLRGDDGGETSLREAVRLNVAEPLLKHGTPCDPIETILNRLFHGDAPRCECCGERKPECRWRPAYQMMLCPECPKRFPKPTRVTK